MVTKARTLADHLESLPDPRSTRGQRHLLLDIILIAVLAVLCGADSWEDIHRFAKSQDAWLRTFLTLPNGVPSADTINRVFILLDPKAFTECFLSWVRDVRKKVPGDVVALDGKTLRASLAAGKSALHMVSAWSSANHMVLGQCAVNEKSNEITAIPALLKVLDLKGCIVTIDAMGCQKGIAKGIVAKKADYLLAVKGNQERLHKAIKACFESLDANLVGTAHGSAESLESRRGRNERRRVTTLDAVEQLPESILLEWPKLETIVRIQSESLRNGKPALEERFYITTLSMTQAEAIGSAARHHWGIENKLHWVLDVAFREDANRTRKGSGPECSAVLRHIVLNLLRQDPNPMGSIKFRRMQAAMSPDYRMAALLGFPHNGETTSI
ncbi:ISAs1 family transposase [Holophaga foetida]|uniref:ISAs1 family transposase n=1 Tax=Holophaga foetida TaxID=35839 RepID=UPI0005B96E54|nr:ISAs1 family transposase [Holophaga foetida]